LDFNPYAVAEPASRSQSISGICGGGRGPYKISNVLRPNPNINFGPLFGGQVRKDPGVSIMKFKKLILSCVSAA